MKYYWFFPLGTRYPDIFGVFFCSFMTGPSPNMSQLRIQAFLAYVAPPPRYSPHFREWIAWPATWWTWGVLCGHLHNIIIS